MLTARTFLVRGLLAGFFAGVVTFGVSYIIGEPPIASSIALEAMQSAGAEQAPADQGHNTTVGDEVGEYSQGEAEKVSRVTQATWGLATATIVFGIALGGIVGLASALAVGRLGRLSPRASTALTAGIGFVAVYFVPFLKYPPVPPAAGNPDSIGDRTGLYFTMLAASVIAAVGFLVLARTLARTIDAWNASVMAIAGYMMVVAVFGWLLPVIDEVPVDFSADLLWQFRAASLAVQATLWTVIGLALAALIHAVVRRSPPRDNADQVFSRPAA